MSIRWPDAARAVDPEAPIDVLLRGGRILTGRDGDTPRFASSVAITRGTIVAVGSDELAANADTRTEVVDLDGRMVIPGLIDSHLHVVRGGLSWTEELRWYEVPSLELALDEIRAEVARTPAGTWIRSVGGWHHGQFHEGRGPTREELTQIAPEHPVYVQLLYEDAILNDAALRVVEDGGRCGGPAPRFVRPGSGHR